MFITFWSPLFVKTKGKCLIFYFKNLNFCVLSLAKIHIYISIVGEEGKNFLDTVRFVDVEII